MTLHKRGVICFVLQVNHSSLNVFEIVTSHQVACMLRDYCNMVNSIEEV